jgi:hypothetical protein
MEVRQLWMNDKWKCANAAGHTVYVYGIYKFPFVTERVGSSVSFDRYLHAYHFARKMTVLTEGFFFTTFTFLLK